MSDLWLQTQRELERLMGAERYEKAFGQLRLDTVQDQTITLVSDDEMAALVAEKNYGALVEQCVATVSGKPWRISFRGAADQRERRARPATPQLSLFDALDSAGSTSGSREAQSPARARTASPRRSEPQHPRRAVTPADSKRAITRTGLGEHFDFARFVVGASNEFAFEAARAVVETPGALYNPLFIYGGVGLGKTHLMQAVGIEALRRDPSLRVRYISAETFVNELIASIGSRTMDEFRQKNRIDVDMLLIDDVQFIAGKERTQEEFFHTFNALHQAGRQIVLTSDRTPSEMPELEERLRSRLTMGLITDIQPPELETRVAILQRRAAQLRFDVSSEVLHYIAEQVRSNVRELHGALLRIGSFARMRRVPITIEVAREQLERVHQDAAQRVDARAIVAAVCDAFGVSRADVMGRKRIARIAQPRKVAMYLARKHTDSSFPQLGEFFKRDHTTVLSAYRSIDKLVKKGDPIARRISSLERRLGLN